MANSKKSVLLADWVIPVTAPPIANGFVVIENERIQHVGSRQHLDSLRLGDHKQHELQGALIPGLVNTHTHLEFSDIETPLGHQGISLPDWIKEVIAYRMRQTEMAKTDAIKFGFRELADTGTVAVGEIATLPFQSDVYNQSQPQIHKTIFLEQLTTNAKLIDDRCTATEAHLSRSTHSSHVTAGVSPHAPYSVHPTLLTKLINISIAARSPIAMHVAETREEIELLDTQSGKFVELLRDLNAWNPTAETSANSIDIVIDELSRSTRSLLVHGNYLTNSQLQTVAKNEISIVFCPRTHAWFGHSKWPLQLALEMGINVCLGTDSRASNPDLNLLNELKAVAQHHPEIGSNTILQLGTLNGAMALGIADSFGSIEPEKSANLCHVSNAFANSSDKSDPFEWLHSDRSSASLVGY